jgi:hypothetical protein
MAITAQGARLTDAHQRSQAQIRAVVLRQLLQVWPMLDPTRLDATSPAFLAAATRLVLGGRQLSARASVLYLQQFRLAEGVAGVAPIMVERPDSALLQSVRTSLTVTGPVSIKQAAARGVLSSTAARTALGMVSGAVARHVLDGGRTVILETVKSDPEARGFARVAGANACAFCAMLAGRGGVYTESTADFEAHDGCGCGAEPVFKNGEYNFPPNTQDYLGAWEQATRGESFERYLEEHPEYRERIGNAKNAAERTSLQVNGPLRWYLSQQRAS